MNFVSWLTIFMMQVFLIWLRPGEINVSRIFLASEFSFAEGWSVYLNSWGFTHKFDIFLDFSLQIEIAKSYSTYHYPES